MSLVFLVIKIFPFFGIAIAIVGLDLTKSFRRKGNKAWVGTLLFSGFFLLATLSWIYFRGDRNADLWFAHLNLWLRHG